ncbi:MAG TPA: RES family NAD+ phosphorylase [Gemmatimonas sp.]|uniref:RES family NAD+ phosphorylase n=1 Tax=Gemmatimonas sp. TaxID=1962908 RepID=UPI002EDA44A2
MTAGASLAAAPVTLFRIAADTPAYGADDRTGAGAKKTGGRWNRPDTAVIYAAPSRALACLETLVHVAPAGAWPFNRYLVEVIVPYASWMSRTIFNPASHVGWDALPAGLVSLDWGTSWARDMTALIAEVPSVIVPEEPNYLLNPMHPDMKAVTVRKVRRWTYDPRLPTSTAP